MALVPLGHHAAAAVVRGRRKGGREGAGVGSVSPETGGRTGLYGKVSKPQEWEEVTPLGFFSFMAQEGGDGEGAPRAPPPEGRPPSLLPIQAWGRAARDAARGSGGTRP